MKQITELTEQEVLQLTDDQLSNMVKFKMAESGIRILEYPTEPEYTKLPAKEWPLYKVEGIDKLFVNREDAEAISKLLKQCKESHSIATMSYINYDSSTSFGKLFVEDDYSFAGFADVKQVDLYREKTMENIKETINANKVLKTDFEAAVKEYKEVEEHSQDIKALIYGTYKDVINKYHRMAEMQYHYQQYVKLADGNEETAMKFLKNAYSIDEQTEHYVQGKDMPTEDVEGYETTDKSEGGAN